MNKFNGTIKLIYKKDNTIINETIILHPENTLQKVLNENKNIQKNNLNNIYLLRNNQKIPLDKNKKINQLNLSSGDSILVSFPEVTKNIEHTRNKLTQHIHNSSNVSTDNLNADITNSEINTPTKRCCKLKIPFKYIFY